MDIPKHIKYLSTLFFLNAAVALFIGGLTLISIFHSALSGENNPDISTVFYTIIRDFGLGILATILAIIALIILGISLRKLKPWARTVTLIYGAMTIFLGLLSLLSGDQGISYHFFVQVYAFWVLSRPEIKEAFNVNLKGRNDPPSSQEGFQE